MTTRTLQLSFGGGIISPELHGRIDDAKYASGLAECNNFIVRPQGSVENRAGFAFVRATKYSGASASRLIQFIYSTDQTMVLEFGHMYIRFHTQGQTLMSGAAPYEIAAPYTAADIFGLRYVQSGDVMTLVHPNYAPRELRRLGAINWTLTTINFGASLPAPTGVTAAPSRGASTETIRYKASTVDTDGLGAGVKWESAAIDFSVDVPTGNSYKVTITISGGTNIGAAPRYRTRVYRSLSGGEYRFMFDAVNDRPYLVFTDNHAPTISSETYPTYNLPPSVWEINPPWSASAVFNGSDTDVEYTYVVTAVDSTGVTQSPSSASASAINDLYQPGASNKISWVAVAGAASYNIYKRDPAGIFGLIGSVTAPTTQFIDKNIIPDSSQTPPIYDEVFNSANNYPSAVTYIEQRRVFAGTNNEPQTVWMTRTGTESDMSYSIPIRDDDRVKFRASALEMSRIRHLVPLVDLLLMTNSTEFRVTSFNRDAISPTSISISAQTYIGANNVPPKIANNTMLYCAERGGQVYESAYDWQYSGFRTSNISVRAPHLFDGKRIVDMTYAKAPLPIAWLVSSGGELLGLTYLPEQQVCAWHRHTTDGAFESVAAVAEGDDDYLYAVVNRSVNGATVRYIERMASRRPAVADPGNIQNAFFVDSGLSYTGPAKSAFTGLSHLEGKTVAILADGGEHRQLTVSGGAITLDYAASVIQVGLPIAASIKTLPAVIQTREGPVSIGRTKDLGKVYLRVFRTAGLSVAVDGVAVNIKERTTEPYGSQPYLQDGELEVLSCARWTDSGQFEIKQTRPLPATILMLSAEVSVGG